MKILIKGLSFFAKHGVFAEEKKSGQNFFVDLELTLNEIGTDSLSETADYGEVARRVKEFAENGSLDLIESVADGIAKTVLTEFRAVRAVKVTVHKPEAPMPVEVEDAAAVQERQWTTVYFGLGSNLGDREAYLDGAVRGLRERGFRVTAVSSYRNTEPYGVPDQPDFLNACVRAETFLTPMECLAVIRALEAEAGRVKTRRWGERTLDADLLLYGNETVCTEELTVPHGDLHNRAFVLEPLCEIAPYAVHPILKKTVKMLWEDLQSGDAHCIV